LLPLWFASPFLAQLEAQGKHLFLDLTFAYGLQGPV
jgi:hypothetical protein